MGLINKLKGLWSMIFENKAKELYDVKEITPAEMATLINRCGQIYRGTPYWLTEGVRTINFAKSVCSETARLTTLGIKVTIDGSARGKYLQEQFDKYVYYNLRQWLEYGCGYGSVILKPNGASIDVYTPDRFMITDHANGNVTGAVFVSQEISGNGKEYYTRFEFHRFENDGNYKITNNCFVSDNPNDIGKPIAIVDTPWSDIEEETSIGGLDKPLFALFKTPEANNIDIKSALGMPCFYDAIQELRDLDIAYSRNATEIEDSERTILVDDALVQGVGKNKDQTAVKLPRFARKVYGSGQGEYYQEINPTLNTATRLEGINALLSQIGYKVGFSNGYFVFNEKQGIQTATGIEAEQQRSIQFIKDMRDRLESCVDDLINAMDAFATLYDLAPEGTYETNYDFGDITYNYAEDKATWLGYVSVGLIPKWKYLEKFEGMTEEEAKALVEEANPQIQDVFGAEEE